MIHRPAPCQVLTKSGWMISGFLFMRNDRFLILLNNLSQGADLGPFRSVRDKQIYPEADILVIPAKDVKMVSKFKLSK